MANKKISKKGIAKTNKKRLIIVVSVVVTILAILWAGWWLIFRYNAYSPDKETIRKDARSLYDSIALAGNEVYSTFSDTGCDDSHAVGISTNIYCSFVGYKYFEADESLSQSLKAADAQIRAAGWQRTFNPQNYADVDYILSDSNNQAVSYLNPDNTSRMVASLGYYRSDVSKSDTYLQGLIRDGKVKPPASGKYLYGIRVGATYWSCNSNSLFKICPPAPSKPHF